MRMLLLFPLCFLIDAYAIWLVWGWHGVPVGLPAITLWRAAGLSALVNLFTFRVPSTEIDRSLEIAKDKARDSTVFWTARGVWGLGVLAIVGTAYLARILGG